MTTPTLTPTSRRTFLTRMLAAAGLAPLAAAAYSLSKPAQTQFIPCAQTEAYLKRVYAAKGAAIKVPSNRLACWNRGLDQPPIHDYVGDWNGTFRLEHGCTNPAYVLAHLYERTGAEPDWVVNDVGRVTTRQGEVVSYSARPKSTWGLDWTMLYHWGQACDEPSAVWKEVTQPDGRSTRHVMSVSQRPRFTVSAFCSTPEEMIALRETLRMHCLSWQSTDPRYRTSWPGVGYPEGRA